MRQRGAAILGIALEKWYGELLDSYVIFQNSTGRSVIMSDGSFVVEVKRVAGHKFPTQVTVRWEDDPLQEWRLQYDDGAMLPRYASGTMHSKKWNPRNDIEAWAAPEPIPEGLDFSLEAIVATWFQPGDALAAYDDFQEDWVIAGDIGRHSRRIEQMRSSTRRGAAEEARVRHERSKVLGGPSWPWSLAGAALLFLAVWRFGATIRARNGSRERAMDRISGGRRWWSAAAAAAVCVVVALVVLAYPGVDSGDPNYVPQPITRAVKPAEHVLGEVGGREGLEPAGSIPNADRAEVEPEAGDRADVHLLFVDGDGNSLPGEDILLIRTDASKNDTAQRLRTSEGGELRTTIRGRNSDWLSVSLSRSCGRIVTNAGPMIMAEVAGLRPWRVMVSGVIRHVSGRVTSDSCGAPGARVGNAQNSATTDDNGYYSLDLASFNGRLKLSCEKPGYILERKALRASRSELVCDWDLEAGGVLAGRVLDHQGQAIADASVLALANMDMPGNDMVMTKSKTDGSYLLIGLPANKSVNVSVYHDMYDGTAEDIVMASQVKRDWVLSPSIWMRRGRVVDGNGNGIAGASVGVDVSRIAARACSATKTDESGYFSVKCAGYGSAWYAARAPKAFGERRVRLSDKEVVIEVEPLQVVRGRVLSGSNKGVSGALVYTRSGGIVLSGEGGEFEVLATPDEDVRVTKSGYVNVTTRGVAEEPMEILLPEAGVLRGRLLQPGSQDPVQRFCLSIELVSAGSSSHSASVSLAWVKGVWFSAEDGAWSVGDELGLPMGTEVQLTFRDGVKDLASQRGVLGNGEAELHVFAR